MLKWIVAMDSDRIIGKDWWIPRHEKEDLIRFKKFTKDQICIMWKTTYDWLKKYRPNAEWYPHAKKNIILNKETFQEIIKYQTKKEIARITWWAKTFELLMPYIDEMYVTIIPWKHEWDTYMPRFEHYFNIVESEISWDLEYRTYKKI